MAKAREIVNAITRKVNEVYKPALPYVTKTTFSNFAASLQEAPDLYRNEWINTLVNVVFAQYFMNKRQFESYFRALKKGDTRSVNLQLIMIDAIKARAYDKNATSLILENNPPEVGVQYLQEVVKIVYPVTVVEELLWGAFSTEDNFMSFMDAIAVEMFSSYEDDTNQTGKLMLDKNIEEGNVYLVPKAKPTDKDGVLDFMTDVQTLGDDWAVSRSRKYNLAGFRTFTPKDELVLMVNTRINAINDQYNLATAFHEEYNEMRKQGRVIKMDSESIANGDVFAMLYDDNFLQIHDIVTFPKVTTFYNAGTLAMNRYLHYQGVWGLSFFSNAVAFIDETKVGIESAVVDTRSGSANANRGDEVRMYVKTVSAASGKYADKYGTWSIAGNESESTVIDPDKGVLTIGKDETGETITVTWTSHLDSGVTATKAITVNQ